jgi:endonuclease/exonuclease/phosphatase (EEP) superfamily protein YafD
MRSTITVLALSLLGCGPGQSEVPPAPATAGESTAPSPEVLTIGSYNVLYLRAESRPGVDPASWADPDTRSRLVLQETNDAWEGAIRAVQSARYPHCVFHPPKRFLPEGLAVCSRHPVEQDRLLASKVGWFPAQRVRVQAPSGPVEILNVHLRPAVAGPANWMDVHRATRPDRKIEIEAYLADLPDGAAALVVGDFNELPEGDLFRSLAAAGFESALPRAGEHRATWRWEGTEPLLEAQLDHVAYTSTSFDLVSAKVLEGGNSDHVPVVVTLRRRR